MTFMGLFGVAFIAAGFIALAACWYANRLDRREGYQPEAPTLIVAIGLIPAGVTLLVGLVVGVARVINVALQQMDRVRFGVAVVGMLAMTTGLVLGVSDEVIYDCDWLLENAGWHAWFLAGCLFMD